MFFVGIRPDLVHELDPMIGNIDIDWVRVVIKSTALHRKLWLDPVWSKMMTLKGLPNEATTTKVGRYTSNMSYLYKHILSVPQGRFWELKYIQLGVPATNQPWKPKKQHCYCIKSEFSNRIIIIASNLEFLLSVVRVNQCLECNVIVYRNVTCSIG